jgi:hypothetical protein
MDNDILEMYTGKTASELTDEELIQLAKGSGKYIDAAGYVRILRPDHHRANSRGYVGEHVLALEEKLGRFLTPDETPHHKDKNPGNNSPSNLELLSTRGLHRSHHQGLQALKACGHSDWRQCCYCHEWDDPDNMVIYPRSARHVKCAKLHNEKRYANRRLPIQEAAFLACGHADWRKCKYCRKYADIKDLYVSPNKAFAYHRTCHAKYQRERKVYA